MKPTHHIPVPLVLFLACLLGAPAAHARPEATLKYSLIREENPKGSKAFLALPYGFPSESMGFTLGVGAMAKGFGQEQLLMGATAYGSGDDAAGFIGGVWDFRPTGSDRFYLSLFGSMGYYPRQRAYAEIPGRPMGDRAGSNDSDEDDYIEDGGNDNWFDIKLEYVLPLGSMRNSGMGAYRLKDGMLVSGAIGGGEWNPLKSGATVLVLRQYNRYQTYETDSGKLKGTIHPVEFGILYNNTDFNTNPSRGSSQYLAVTRDFAWGESEEEWTFIEFEASKYFSLGETDLARQRVLALNFWTGDAPSWKETVNERGEREVSNRPPFLAGATLGGYHRMRGYPKNRFNGRSVIYTAAEYRYIPRWNPIGRISWLEFLQMDWWQFVGFVEGGRVADEYDLSELFSDWKADVGVGLRAMLAGGVVRFDVGFSEEGAAAWAMFNHPF